MRSLELDFGFSFCYVDKMNRCLCLMRPFATSSRAASSSARQLAPAPTPGPPRREFEGTSLSTSSDALDSTSSDELRSVDGFYNSTNILHFSNGFDPSQKYSPQQLDSFWRSATKDQLHHTSHRPAATPYSVRAIPVGQKQPLHVAYANLQKILRQSNIRAELKRGEEYEKPTAYRHRMASQRHRRRFKHEVGQKIATIMRMKKKGL
jgi:ribosomal protein S21